MLKFMMEVDGLYFRFGEENDQRVPFEETNKQAETSSRKTS